MDGLDEYLEHIKADYDKWSGGKIHKELRDRFVNTVRFEVGNKYIKVLTENSVHSFVCIKDVGKFVRGDILKAASYNAPARNFARGNVITRDFTNVTWTGAN